MLDVPIFNRLISITTAALAVIIANQRQCKRAYGSYAGKGKALICGSGHISGISGR